MTRNAGPREVRHEGGGFHGQDDETADIAAAVEMSAVEAQRLVGALPDQRSRLRHNVERVALLDADPDLGARLTGPTLDAARRALEVRELRLAPGAWEQAEARATTGLLGAIVRDGYLLRETRMVERVSAQLFGPGDIVAPWLDAGGAEIATQEWSVLRNAKVLVLDLRLIAALRSWPSVSASLMERWATQLNRVALHLAISQQARIETRVLGMLWDLAERWGRMTSDGVVVPLALTHDLLGRLVGARRPTVSLAVKRLRDAGTLRRRADGLWLLDPQSLPTVDVLHRRLPARLPAPPRLTRAGLVPQAPVATRVAERQRLEEQMRRLTEAHRLSIARTRETLARCLEVRAHVSDRRQELRTKPLKLPGD